MEIFYGTAMTIYGNSFIAYADESLCALEFIECKESAVLSALERLKSKWPEAEFIHDENISGRQNRGKLLVKGTLFQIQVWEALLKIPFGEVVTYSQIAKAVGRESAVRAVASAIGKNPIAYFIPCHRVIRKSGDIGEYRWGKELKKQMLDEESK